MMFKSIRSRLSLSHGLVAMFSTLLLGGLVIGSLATYYRWREAEYLADNGAAVSSLLVGLILESSDLEFVEAQINIFSILTQTRVKLLDTNSLVLADSGSPNDQTAVAQITLSVEDDNTSQSLSRTIIGEEEEVDYTAELLINDGVQALRTSSSVTIERTNPGEIFATPLSLFSEAFELSGTFGEDDRSTQRLQRPIQTITGETIGYVELSEGPAYGRPVVTTVAVASLVAGIITFFAASGLGNWFSGRFSQPLITLGQTAQTMRSGDLTARSGINRPDEIGELAASFDQMADRLEETVDTLRRFVADAAHEISTPITALKTQLELAQLEPDNEQFYRQALAQTDRLAQLTADLIHLSRIENQDQIEMTPVDLIPVVVTWGERLASAAEQLDINFSLQVPEEQTPLQVRTNISLLERALANLSDNALKFTPAHGAISVELLEGDGEVLLTITDTGIGLGENSEKIFERFYRTPEARTYPGSGLGLAVAQRIISLHDGTIIAENRNPGAKFGVKLPLITRG